MLTSLALGIVGRSSSSSVIEGVEATTPAEAPADPGQQQ
jgi:hypothetical protein